MNQTNTNPKPEEKADPIAELNQLQSRENQGRGICCVRSILTYLQRGMIEEAEACASSENDKIRNYPKVQLHLRTILPQYHAMLSKWEAYWAKHHSTPYKP